jgi:uncharacterized protein YndB with AHSA1/START domain
MQQQARPRLARSQMRGYSTLRERPFGMPGPIPTTSSSGGGPIGFTTTTKHIDFHPGGQCLNTMHGPDGTDYPNEITYKVIEKPSRIEYEHGDCPLFYTTVIFEDLGGKTRLSMRMLFNSTEDRDDTERRYGAIEGLEQTLGRLEQYLTKH